MKNQETGESKCKEVSRCAFCGNVIRDYMGKHGAKAWAASTRYCGRCRHEGFDNVHIVTGRTNGWEKRLGLKGVFGRG